MQYPERKRRIDIDILKGILILLVVAGHQAPRPVSTIIYWFHMPSFFIISGLLYRGECQKKQYFLGLKEEHNIRPTMGKTIGGLPQSVGDFILKKAKSLLLPYLVYCILIVLIWEESTEDFFFDVICGGSRYTYGVYWFIPALFITEVLFDIIIKWVEKFIRGQELILGALVLILVGVSAFYSERFYVPLTGDYTGWPLHYKVPWSLDVCLLALAYYTLGYLLGRISNQRIKTIMLAVGAAAFGICAYLGFKQELTYIFDMKTVHYPSFFYNLLLPVSGFLFSFLISKGIMKIPGLNKALTEVGKESMAIMFLHGQFLVLLGIVAAGKWQLHWSLNTLIAASLSFALIKLYRLVKGMLKKRWK